MCAADCKGTLTIFQSPLAAADVYGVAVARIVTALEVELTDTARRALVKFSTRDTEAHDYYLRGRQFFYRSKGQSIEFALEMFSRATEQDPDYARAYAGIADCNSYLFMYFGGDERHLAGAERASAKALAPMR